METDIGFVYLVQIGNMVKVGMTNHLGRRLMTLQTGLPEPLVLRYAVIYPSRASAVRLEQKVHAALAHRRVSGEWFRVDIEEAIEAISRISMRMQSRASRKTPVKRFENLDAALKWAEAA